MNKLERVVEKLNTNTRKQGFFLFIFTIITFLSIISFNPNDNCLSVISSFTTKNLLGNFGAFYSDLLLQIFGIEFFIMIAFCFYLSFMFFTRRPVKHILPKTVYTVIAMVSVGWFFCCLPIKSFSVFLSTGIIVAFLSSFTQHWFIKIPVMILLFLVFSFYPYCVFFNNGKGFYKKIATYNRKLKQCSVKIVKVILLFCKKCCIPFKKMFCHCFKGKNILKPVKDCIDNRADNGNDVNIVHLADDNNKTSQHFGFFKKTSFDKQANNDENEVIEMNGNTKQKPFILPPVELLSYSTSKTTFQNEFVCREKMLKLEKILGEFGVRGTMVGYKAGPIVTLYEFRPQSGVKSSRVIGLSSDIARMMLVGSVRISTITGKDTLGIEVPNDERSVVCFRKLVESKAYENNPAILPLILGSNIFGSPVVVDLTTMPHLLIAGTTGSGKSVGINGMILSMLYKLPPEKCRFIMIDPKMLEFSLYDGIPNLLMPVVTDAKKAVLALKWVVGEMEHRYRRMSDAGVRNIIGYNERVDKLKGNKKSKKNPIIIDNEYTEVRDDEQMPYIVVIIDEMADLMVVAGKEIEVLVQRLSQMARAAGIHLIMATQRPSVDVITGVIKANFPTRIAYQVSSKIDSRTIIGEQGAEQLLGKGDMLYVIGGAKITRVHGPFIMDTEVEKTVNFLKENNDEPKYVSLLKNGDENNDAGGFTFSDGLDGYELEGGDEGMYRQAVRIVLDEKKTSISYLQRKLRIGYNKAANFIERMEEEGILSSPDNTGKRTIL